MLENEKLKSRQTGLGKFTLCKSISVCKSIDFSAPIHHIQCPKKQLHQIPRFATRFLIQAASSMIRKKEKKNHLSIANYSQKSNFQTGPSITIHHFRSLQATRWSFFLYGFLLDDTRYCSISSTLRLSVCKRATICDIEFLTQINIIHSAGLLQMNVRCHISTFHVCINVLLGNQHRVGKFLGWSIEFYTLYIILLNETELLQNILSSYFFFLVWRPNRNYVRFLA